ncbi:MAG: DUF126 domain-containing protein [Candidatus Hodarchaeales archaeon]|jgi:predicted aconitase with swiveling domain
MKLEGRRICKGKATGEALVSSQAISFYGGVDPETGEVVEKDHELEGQSVSGKVLVFPNGKGSTVGPYVLYQLAKADPISMAPLAIVNAECEAIVAVGAIISEIPCVDKIDLSYIKSGDKVEVDGDNGTVKIDSD